MDKVIDFINKTTNEEKLFLLDRLAKDICVAHYHTDKKSIEVMGLCDVSPTAMNGTSFQLNTKDFMDYMDEKEKEVSHG